MNKMKNNENPNNLDKKKKLFGNFVVVVVFLLFIAKFSLFFFVLLHRKSINYFLIHPKNKQTKINTHTHTGWTYLLSSLLNFYFSLLFILFYSIYVWLTNQIFWSFSGFIAQNCKYANEINIHTKLSYDFVMVLSNHILIIIIIIVINSFFHSFYHW